MAIRSVRPNLEVADLDETIRFFGDLLGLGVLSQVEGPTPYALLGENEAVLGAVQLDEIAVAEIVTVYIEVDDLDAVHQRAVETGLSLAQPPTTHPWGQRDLVAVHPDGHLVGVWVSVEAVEPADDSVDGIEPAVDLSD